MTYIPKTVKKKKIDRDALQLDSFEQEISTQVMKDDFVPVEDIETWKQTLMAMTTKTWLTKSKSVKISLTRPSDQLSMVQDAAAKEGMKYQPFIKSVLYKYITGQIE